MKFYIFFFLIFFLKDYFATKYQKFYFIYESKNRMQKPVLIFQNRHKKLCLLSEFIIFDHSFIFNLPAYKSPYLSPTDTDIHYKCNFSKIEGNF